MSKFVGRKEEFNLLKGLLHKSTSSLVVVYGRRRIGKSRLIEEFAKPYKFISFSGLYPENNMTKQNQLDDFRDRFKEQFGIDAGPLTSWTQAFHKLAGQTRKGRVIILLDEISWMAHGEIGFLLDFGQ